MRILFVADGRSPIALNWIAYFVENGHEVHLTSTFACRTGLPFASVTTVPVAFSTLKSQPASTLAKPHKRGELGGVPLVRFRTTIRQWLGPLTIPGAARQLKTHIDKIQPDIVHAMRIPFEGMLAARAYREHKLAPLIISVWGNDFTLHARANPWMRRLTRESLQHADGLHVDCQRDLHLARQFGFSGEKPAVVLPGNGGVQTEIFYPPGDLESRREILVINPRGVRAYVRNDTFFRAVPIVLAQKPDIRFVCPAMESENEAIRWLDELKIWQAVDLLPKLSRPEMAELFRKAQVSVSPATHDGTPNTLLEAMACGSFPVAGNLDSIREWITPGVNGLLVDLSDPTELAQAILTAMDQPDLRSMAAQINRKLVQERAEYRVVMEEALQFYRSVIK